MAGEPFLREDLFEIAEYTAKRDILFNITTNGSLIDDALAMRINEQIDHTQLTFTEYDGANLDAASKLSRFGFNLLVTPAIASRFKDILLLLDSYGPDNILLMDPKPTDLGWYNRNKIGTAEKNAIIKTAKQMQKRMTAKYLLIPVSLLNWTTRKAAWLRVESAMLIIRMCIPALFSCAKR